MEQEKIWDYFQNEGLGDRKFPEARQRFMLGYLKPKKIVLNIGVGEGTLERLGLGKGVDMHSLDPSARAIERLRESLPMDQKVRTGFAQDIPFDENTFDAVVMSEVLEHLDDDVLAKSLDGVRRVLKPGGFLLASTPYREDIGANRVVCPECGNVFHKVGHVQSFSKERMRDLLIQHKYDVRKLWITTFIDWRRSGIKNLLKSCVRWTLARMGEDIADPHLVVIAKKTIRP